MKFYINSLCDWENVLNAKHSYGQFIIGLFRQCKTDGRGNFCGYYGTEYYLNGELYAYYVTENTVIYKPEARLGDVTVLKEPIRYQEVQIGSHMWTNVIEASSIEEAIDLFKNAKWRRWDYSVDSEVEE